MFGSPSKSAALAVALFLAPFARGFALHAQDGFDSPFVDDSDPRSAAEILDAAYRGLYECLDGRDFEIKPRSDKSVAEQLEARYGVGLTAVLREKARVLDRKLQDTAKSVRAWIPSATDAARREHLLEEEFALDQLRHEALALIDVYEKKDQNKVDANRKRVEAAYSKYERLVDAEFAWRKDIDAAVASDVLALLRRGEETMTAVDLVLEGRGEEDVDRLESDDEDSPFSAPGAWHETECPYLAEVPWVLLEWSAGREVTALREIDDLVDRIDHQPTSFERWLLRELRARAVDEFNARCVDTLTELDAQFTPAINTYRRGLGLELLTIDERLVQAARKHSQHQVDNGYFAHESTDKRKYTPWDRMRIEDYEGGGAENLAQGRHDGKSVFEAWYRSPGHHRNMVGRHREFGAATDSSGSIWTLVLGRGDIRWREWHPDLSPQREHELAKDAARYAKTILKGGIKPKEWERDVVPILPEIDDTIGASILAAAYDEGGSPRQAVTGTSQLLSALFGARTLECALVSQILTCASRDTDAGLRRETEEFLRLYVPGLAPELDAVAKKEAEWTDVQIAWEDRERAHFKTSRNAAERGSD
ncbi:MAG: CAP domain-containing protein [Planctomycetota bacterium]